MVTQEQQPSFITGPGSAILALQRATHETLRVLAARLADEHLSGSEINVLANLADGQVRSVGDLAADAGTRPTTLTSLLDRLVARGLLTRELDPADRRSFRLHLTSEGQRAATAARDAMAAIEQDRLRAITPAELAGFHAVVKALTGVEE